MILTFKLDYDFMEYFKIQKNTTLRTYFDLKAYIKQRNFDLISIFVILIWFLISIKR